MRGQGRRKSRVGFSGRSGASGTTARSGQDEKRQEMEFHGTRRPLRYQPVAKVSTAAFT
jgi:hypothetical protein